MQEHILRVFEYFNFFSYPISFKNIHKYLEIKISEKRLKQELKQLISEKIVHYRHGLYTLGEYGNDKVRSQKSKACPVPKRSFWFRVKTSQKKIDNWRFRAYIKLISLFSQIKLIGISGSVAMNNAEEKDDIDLFIVTAKNRLFTGRFIAMVLAQLTGLRRHRQLEKLDTVFFDRLTPKGPQAIVSKKVSSLSSKNKVCLNLFFDETELNIPKFKKNYYVAHEIMQMKPIINKNNAYERFLYSNRWVCDIFPNIQHPRHPGASEASDRIYSNKDSIRSEAPSRMTFVGNYVELILKKMQLLIINRHKTTELITDKQLWFFPDDFENRLPKWTRRKYNT